MITIIKIRPIDMLAHIVKNISQSPHDQYTLEILEGFIDKYTLLETCSMLVQIVVDAKDAAYMYSRRFEQAMKHQKN